MKELKKKIIVIEEGPLGSNIFETIAEEVRPIGKTGFHMKKNPDKKTVFQVTNKWKERLNLVWYKGNDFLNVFIDGGMYKMRFIITRDQLERLVSTCTKYIIYIDREIESYV